MALKDHLFFGNTYCAVEYSFDSEGNEVLYCLQLTKSKGELLLANSDKFFTTESLFEHLKKIDQKHLVVLLNNKQVLSKSVTTLDDNETRIFKSAFPTLSLQDFYLQIEESPNTSFISIVRQDYVQQILEEFNSNDLKVLDIALGNLSISSIIPMISSNDVFTSNAKLTLEQNAIQSISKHFQVNDYDINGLHITSEYLLSLGAIVNFYLYNTTQYKKELVSSFKDQKLFNLGYKVALGVIFILVLINFLFFNNYNTKVNQLSQELEIKKDAKLTLKKLNDNVTKKKKLVAELQNSSSFSVAKYTDQIVTSIPKSIVLTEINYQPLVGVLKEGKEAKFKGKEIEVKGVLNDYVEFTNWIDEIEKKEWVEKLLELSTEKEKRKKNTNFHLLILIK
ncbi:hypothetical protein [Tenacibaculum agarivorans]|uniref:hypothetical protein n=1 Tax=Tenacibaculum agarivorans TaxID=1908389 RepID=UPI00094B8B5F|nr:hypothetical protein [Tenacibaculum agarivorans]